MAGRFVRGGVQHNILEQREKASLAKLYGDSKKHDESPPKTVSATGWGTGASTANTGLPTQESKPDQSKQQSGSKEGQYSVEKTYGKQDDTLAKYQEKLAEASVRLTVKATAKIIKDAEERQRDRNNQWMDRSRYNEEQAQRRYDQYGYDSFNQMKNFNEYSSKEGYITHPKTGFRYRPRKFDDKMNHTESRGWLHCWTQIMDFDAPEYQVVQSGKAPRQSFEATLTVKTRRGEIIDCQPTYVAKSKKAACTEVAWMFVEEMVERGLLQKDKVPSRDESEQLSSQSGINNTDVKSIDLSPESRASGGGWNLAQAIHRFHTFCQLIKCPMDIKLNAYGPDHDRKTDAHITVKFQVIGEEDQRVYTANHTCQNKKQAQAAAALTMVRQLYRDGYIEGFRKPMKMPPRVIFSKSEGTADQNPMDEEEKKITGGWVMANSMNALTVILKRWNIDPNFWCEPRGKPSKYTFIMFISELRLTLTMRTQAQLTTKHELFAFGRQKSKKDSRSEAAVSMMRQLYKFGICQAAYQSTHRPGANAHLWEISLGLQGAPYEPDDIYVTNKLNTMRPDPTELTYPSMVVSHIEAALKCCSDWLHEEEIAEEYASALANKRTLLGMQRVGPIAMDMMLTGERRAHVVLTCGRRPTRHLLEQVAGKTIEMLQYTSRGFLNYNQMQTDFKEYHQKLDEAEEQAKQELEMEEQAKKAAEQLETENKDAEASKDKDEEADQHEDTTETEEIQKETIVAGSEQTAASSNLNTNTWQKMQEKPQRPNPEYYTIGIEHSNSGFIINYGVVTPRKMTVRVTLTSSLIRDDLMLAKKQAKDLAKKEADEKEPKRKKVKKEAADPDEKSSSDKKKKHKKDKERDKETEDSSQDSQTQSKEEEEDKDAAKEVIQVKETEEEQAEAVKDEEPAAPLTNFNNGWAAMAPMMPTEDDKANFKYGPYASNMTLEDCEIMEKEIGSLPTQPGLGALAELRRIKWFQHIGLNTPYLPDICRLIRGLAIREGHWKSFRILCPWTIALILENIIRYEVKTHQNTALTLSPARVLKLSLETISKGFRFPVEKKEKKEEKVEVKDEVNEVDKFIADAKKESSRSRRDESEERSSRRYTHKLIDPCEANEEYDALTHIPSNRKSDIRACAKLSLDLINREQIWMLLNTAEIDGLNMGGGEHEVPADERERIRRRENWYTSHGKFGNAITNEGGIYNRVPNSAGYGNFGSYTGSSRTVTENSRDSRSDRDTHSSSGYSSGSRGGGGNYSGGSSGTSYGGDRSRDRSSSYHDRGHYNDRGEKRGYDDRGRDRSYSGGHGGDHGGSYGSGHHDKRGGYDNYDRRGRY